RSSEGRYHELAETETDRACNQHRQQIEFGSDIDRPAQHCRQWDADEAVHSLRNGSPGDGDLKEDLRDAQRDDRECSARETDCNKADRDPDRDNANLATHHRTNETPG